MRRLGTPAAPDVVGHDSPGPPAVGPRTSGVVSWSAPASWWSGRWSWPSPCGRTEPGSAQFYGATLLLAAVWAGGAFASGPLHLGRVGIDASKAARPVVQPILVGVGLSLVFIVGAFIVRLIPPLADQVRAVLDFAGEGTSPVLLLVVTVLNGIAEEMFFRGALYAVDPQAPGADHLDRLRHRDRGHRQRDARASPRWCSASSWVSSAAPAAASSRRSSRTSCGR